MSKDINAHTLYNYLSCLDWTGHFEIPQGDLLWLAREITSMLNSTSEADVCDVCGLVQPIVVKTKIGRICETCISETADEAKEAREEIEESDSD